MTPEQAEQLLSLINNLIIINQAMLYMFFVLLGGLAVYAFFDHWKEIK